MSRYTSKHTGSEIDAAIDRAKAGGTIDTLLAGKAPAGYGLGTKSKRLTSNDDLNNIYQGGFYYWYGDNVPANIPTRVNYAGMFVIARSSTEFVQIVYGMASSLNYRNAELIRTAYNGVWYEWEWVNPPMVVGTEYRTTERYLGKPVYVKVVDFGAGANNTEKGVEHGASNAIVIDYGGYAKNGNGALSVPWMTHSTLSVSNTVIVMTADANYSGYNVYVWIKYYKTTD